MTPQPLNLTINYFLIKLLFITILQFALSTVSKIFFLYLFQNLKIKKIHHPHLLYQISSLFKNIKNKNSTYIYRVYTFLLKIAISTLSKIFFLYLFQNFKISKFIIRIYYIKYRQYLKTLQIRIVTIYIYYTHYHFNLQYPLYQKFFSFTYFKILYEINKQTNKQNKQRKIHLI